MLKETSRPINQPRPSFSSGQSILPRNSLPRSGTYSSSFGSSYNPIHRVSRRKSSTLSPAAITAAKQVLEGQDDKSASRRSFQSRIALGALNPTGLQSPPNSLPGPGMMTSKNESALVDGPPLSSSIKSKDRMRRASDGSALSSKKKPGHGELKCDTCGKGYKHSSCLTKHLWEHTPEWAITSKLLISKHQQVQLLEAASVLVTMNQDAPEVGKSSDSEQSYASPAASGDSEREASVSSIETTPPPAGDYPYGHHKSGSMASSTFSRSYQSTFSAAHPHRRQWSYSSHRPGTAQTAHTEAPGEDQADLAAAVGLLSCSYATPQSGPTHLTSDVPPVPSLPEKFHSLSRVVEREVDMDDAASSSYGDEHSRPSPRRHEEDDEIFGEMDE